VVAAPIFVVPELSKAVTRSQLVRYMALVVRVEASLGTVGQLGLLVDAVIDLLLKI
jgi:hypothetical protein